jgi:hypothetical protein
MPVSPNSFILFEFSDLNFVHFLSSAMLLPSYSPSLEHIWNMCTLFEETFTPLLPHL